MTLRLETDLVRLPSALLSQPSTALEEIKAPDLVPIHCPDVADVEKIESELLGITRRETSVDTTLSEKQRRNRSGSGLPPLISFAALSSETIWEGPLAFDFWRRCLSLTYLQVCSLLASSQKSKASGRKARE